MNYDRVIKDNIPRSMDVVREQFSNKNDARWRYISRPQPIHPRRVQRIDRARVLELQRRHRQTKSEVK